MNLLNNMIIPIVQPIGETIAEFRSLKPKGTAADVGVCVCVFKSMFHHGVTMAWALPSCLFSGGIDQAV